MSKKHRSTSKKAPIFRQWPIWRLIVLFLALILASLVYASGIAVRIYETDFLLKLQKDNLDRAFSLLVATSITPIITEDIPLLETIISETVKSTPQIHSLNFQNEDGMVLTEWKAAESVTEFPPLILEDQILFEEESFGKLTISWNLDSTHHRIEEHVWKARIGVSAMLAILSLMVLVLFHIIFIRPLNKVYEQLLDLTKRAPTEKIDLNISREFYRVSSAVNRFGEFLVEREKYESEIEEVNQSLRKANEELNNTQLQLVQSAKLASLGEISTSIAHELKNPLGTILLTCELSEMYLEDGDLTKLVSNVEQIKKQTERATSIINHMRKYGRDASKSEKKPLSVMSLIDNSLILLRKQLSTQNIELVIKVPEDLPKLIGNEIQVEQVITNLVNNARDAMEDVTPKKLWIIAYVEEQNIVIEVQDTAGGIPDSVLENIFDSYFTTKGEDKGTGLGLSISQNIIKEHGGKLSVDSRLGDGSTFKISLPAYEEEE